ncbi:MAG: dodecin domain-containing protein [Planctomycetes bacterium]|nr:dodecin domain-containing protein [Planctomycetota bacterium]
MVVKVIELLSTSPNSWEEAAQNAVTEATKTIRDITGVDVIGFKGTVKKGKIVDYKAHVRVAFTVE